MTKIPALCPLFSYPGLQCKPPKIRLRIFSGFTLLEMLITLALFGLISLVLFSAIGSTLHHSTLVTARQSRQRQLATVMERITHNLPCSHAESISLTYPSGSPSQGDLILALATPYDSAGNFVTAPNEPTALYQAFLIYYLNPSDHTVYEKRLPLPGGPSTAPTPLTSAQLIGLADGTGRIVARNIGKLYVYDPTTEAPTDQPTNPLGIMIESDTPSNPPRPEPLAIKSLTRVGAK